MMKTTLAVLTCAIVTSVPQLHSASVSDWYWNNFGNVPGSPPPDAANFSDSASGAVTGDFYFYNGSFFSPDLPLGGGYSPVIGNVSLNLGNLTSQRYTSFTVSAITGKQLNLQSLTHGAWNITDLLIGAPGYAPTEAMWGYRINTGSGFGGWTLQNNGAGFTLQLSNDGDPSHYQTWDFADFSTIGTVEFGFWAWNGITMTDPDYAAVGVGRIMGMGDIPSLSVNGTVSSISAVPEPSTYGVVFGSSLLIFVVVRMCRRRVAHA